MDEKTKEKTLAKGGEIQEAKPLQSIAPLMDVDRLFDDFLSRNWLSPFRFNWPGEWRINSALGIKVPNVDVVDRDDEILIRAEIPGVDKQDLDVTMTEDTVTIKGRSRKEEKEEKGDYYHHEISEGSFSRTLSLPCDINAEKVKSSFNGSSPD
jgi:HSP20 family protein